MNSPTVATHPPLTISVEEAAKLLGISKSHAYDLIREDQLPHVYLGRRVVVPYRQLEDWLLDHIVGDSHNGTH